MNLLGKYTITEYVCNFTSECRSIITWHVRNLGNMQGGGVCTSYKRNDNYVQKMKDDERRRSRKKNCTFCRKHEILFYILLVNSKYFVGYNQASIANNMIFFSCNFKIWGVGWEG